MTLEWVHPGLLLILGAWVLPFLKGGSKRAAMLLLPAAAVVVCVYSGTALKAGNYGQISFLGQQLVFGRVDALSLVFSYVFSAMSLVGMIYALHVDDDAQHVAALTYAGGALGVTFAGDFLSLYVFWELMAISSVFLVWLRRDATAVAAGFRYLLVHVFGGLILLAGIVLYANAHGGSLAFGDLGDSQHSLGWTLILIAFLVNAAAPPLGAWLPDAYPNATVTGAVFLSAFTTKSAIYVLIRGFPGTEVLVWLGAGMTLYGMVYAVLENDARRVLAYDIISQLGYMICGIGIGTHMALNGATAHAFAHIFYKALLFMSAGAVLQVTSRRKLSEMGGLYKTMPITMALCLVGALSISAVPLFSGFVSKSMVVSATGDPEWQASLAHREIVFLMLTVAASGTFLHTGLRLPYFMFFGKDAGLTAREPGRNMLVAMGIAAAACVLIGVAYPLLYANLPYEMEKAYRPYTAAHITSSLGLLAFTGLGFCLLRKQLQPEPGMCVDTDWFYRRLADPCLRVLRGPLTRFEFGFVGQIYEYVIRGPVLGVARWLCRFDGRVVDNTAMGVGRWTQLVSGKLSTLVSGNAQHYALIMAAGVLTLIVLAMFAL